MFLWCQGYDRGSVHEKAENGASKFMRRYVRWKFHSARPSEYCPLANNHGTRCLNFQRAAPSPSPSPLEKGHRGVENASTFRQLWRQLSRAPRFFSHLPTCNSKWCVLHSRVRCNIATCIRRVLHTGNYKWTKPSCRPTLLRCQIEWWHARHATLSLPLHFPPPTTHAWSSSPFLFRSISFTRDPWCAFLKWWHTNISSQTKKKKIVHIYIHNV